MNIGNPSHFPILIFPKYSCKIQCVAKMGSYVAEYFYEDQHLGHAKGFRAEVSSEFNDSQIDDRAVRLILDVVTGIGP